MLIATLGALGFAAVVIAIAVAGARPAEPDEPAVLTRPVPWLPDNLSEGTSIGRADAPVTLEVVGDYQCPVCGRFAREYLPRLVADFAVPGTLRIVDRPIAFLGTGSPDESLGAAVGASCAARQGRYWAFHDYLMWNQEGENLGAFAPARLAAMADAAGLDRTSWDACMDEPGVAAAVREATAQSFAAGINSTPTFLVNGHVITGLVPYEQLADAIRAVAG
jgi:protein-disulfide isomerase